MVEDSDAKPDICPTCGMPAAKEVVILSPAYMWDCPACGRENFQRAITIAITDEDRLHMGLGPCEYGCFQSYPNVVICRHCGQKYKAQHVHDDDEDIGDEDEDET